MSGWSMDSDAGRSRMTVDRAFLADTYDWPLGHRCYVKTQPWVIQETGAMRFGYVTAEAPTTVVLLNDGKTETFDSLDELVKVWSVD